MKPGDWVIVQVGGGHRNPNNTTGRAQLVQVPAPHDPTVVALRYPGWGGGHDLKGALPPGSAEGQFVEFAYVTLEAASKAAGLAAMSTAMGSSPSGSGPRCIAMPGSKSRYCGCPRCEEE